MFELIVFSDEEKKRFMTLTPGLLKGWGRSRRLFPFPESAAPLARPARRDVDKLKKATLSNLFFFKYLCFFQITDLKNYVSSLKIKINFSANQKREI